MSKNCSKISIFIEKYFKQLKKGERDESLKKTHHKRKKSPLNDIMACNISKYLKKKDQKRGFSIGYKTCYLKSVNHGDVMIFCI